MIAQKYQYIQRSPTFGGPTRGIHHITSISTFRVPSPSSSEPSQEDFQESSDFNQTTTSMNPEYTYDQNQSQNQNQYQSQNVPDQSTLIREIMTALLDAQATHRARVNNNPATADSDVGAEKKMKYARMRMYDGESRDFRELDTWLFQAEKFFALSRISEDDQVNLISGYLSGKALTWFRTCEGELFREKGDKTMIPWSSFRKGIIAEFSDPNHEDKLRDQWANLRQGRKMSEYISEFRSLRLHLKIPEEVALDKFIRGLKPNTKREVKMRKPATTDEAISLADMCESISVDSYRSISVDSYRATPKHNYSGFDISVPMELDNIQRQGRGNNGYSSFPKSSNNSTSKPWGIWDPATTPAMKDEYSKANRCFRCGIRGHKSSDPNCPRPRDNNRPTRQRVNRSEMKFSEFEEEQDLKEEED